MTLLTIADHTVWLKRQSATEAMTRLKDDVNADMYVCTAGYINIMSHTEFNRDVTYTYVTSANMTTVQLATSGVAFGEKPNRLFAVCLSARLVHLA